MSGNNPATSLTANWPVAGRTVQLQLYPDPLYLRANPRHSVLVSLKTLRDGRKSFVIGMQAPLVLEGGRQICAWPGMPVSAKNTQRFWLSGIGRTGSRTMSGWKQRATQAAEVVYREFLEAVVEAHVLKDRADSQTPYGRALSEKEVKAIKSGNKDPRPIRLMTLSGKGGWVDDPEKCVRYLRNTNITLLDHLLSVVRGGLMIAALDWLARTRNGRSLPTSQTASDRGISFYARY
ncbi:MAG: hypothetical protein R3F53_19305 [Gammaproteobacteria bacterium]